MKKIIIFIFSIVLLGSCGLWIDASVAADSSYIGMTISEFKQGVGRSAELGEMGSKRTVYKMHNYEYDGLFPTDKIIGTKFFYFNSEGKLYQIDEGIPQQKRYEIEHK